jgi:gamma-glutamyltranspeptidase
VYDTARDRPELRALGAAGIATPHHAATAAGATALARGGSAVDALIAAGAVLAVVYPHMTTLGGDGFTLVHDAADGTVHGVEAAGAAAAAADPTAYPDGVPERGPGAVQTVCGLVDGWAVLHARWGRLPWDELFTEATVAARDGVDVADGLARSVRMVRGMLDADPGCATLLRHDRLVQPALARTLERLARHGARDGFYEGETAERLSGFLAQRGSPLRAGDFAAHRAGVVVPLRRAWRGGTVVQMPPPSQGFCVLSNLGMLDDFDDADWADDAVSLVHTATEVARLADADRDAWLADPRHVDVPVDRLLDADYLHRRAALVAPDAVAATVAPGIVPPGTAARRPPAGGTSAIVAADGDGLAVSSLQSVYQAFGAMLLDPATGVLLHNRGSFVSVDPAHPNVLAPGKRPLHTLAPGMVLDADGNVAYAVSTMGGTGQPQTQSALCTRWNRLHTGLGDGVDAPRWLTRTGGDGRAVTWIESTLGPGVADGLRARGHTVVEVAPNDLFGHAMALRVDGDALQFASDPRADGAAAAVPPA